MVVPTECRASLCLRVILLVAAATQIQGIAFAHFRRDCYSRVSFDEEPFLGRCRLVHQHRHQHQQYRRFSTSTRTPPSSEEDPGKQVEEPIMKRSGIHPSYTAAAALFSSTSPTTTTSFSLRRILRLTLVAFLASEVLAYGGFFARAQSPHHHHHNHNHDYNDPPDLASTLQTYFQTLSEKYNLYARWETLRFSTHKWFTQARGPGGILNPTHVRTLVLQTLDSTRENGECATRNLWSVALERYKNLPEKTKFALGGAVGLTSARLLLKLVIKTVKMIGLAYLTLEILDAFGVIGDEEFGLGKLAKDHTGLVAKMEEGLEWMREEVKERFNPRAIGGFLEEVVEEDGVTMSGLAAGSLVGFLL